jgi:hypothetical protein
MNKENLNNAKNTKNDEFYTLLTGYRKGVECTTKTCLSERQYTATATILSKSNFVKWFYMRFNILHLKRIVATSLIIQILAMGGGGYYWDSDFATVDPKTIDISKEIEKGCQET